FFSQSNRLTQRLTMRLRPSSSQRSAWRARRCALPPVSPLRVLWTTSTATTAPPSTRRSPYTPARPSTDCDALPLQPTTPAADDALTVHPLAPAAAACPRRLSSDVVTTWRARALPPGCAA